MELCYGHDFWLCQSCTTLAHATDRIVLDEFPSDGAFVEYVTHVHLAFGGQWQIFNHCSTPIVRTCSKKCMPHFGFTQF